MKRVDGVIEGFVLRRVGMKIDIHCYGHAIYEHCFQVFFTLLKFNAHLTETNFSRKLSPATETLLKVQHKKVVTHFIRFERSIHYHSRAIAVGTFIVFGAIKLPLHV